MGSAVSLTRERGGEGCRERKAELGLREEDRMTARETGGAA